MTPSLEIQTSHLVFTATAVAATAYLINKWHFTPLPGVPGPQPEFLIGNLRNVFLKNKSLWDIWQHLQPYGPLVHLWVGRQRTVWVNDPNLAHEIGKNREIFDVNVNEADLFVVPYMLIALGGDEWKRHRKAMTPVMAVPRLKYLLKKMDHVVNVTIKNIKERIQETDQPIDVGDDFQDTALDIMGYFAFGHAFRDIDDETSPNANKMDTTSLKTAIKVIQRETIVRHMGFGLHRYFGDSKKVQDAKKALNGVVQILLDEWEDNRQKVKENKLNQSEWEDFMTHSFIAQMLGSDKNDFTFEELRGEMSIMIMGGSDTTSVSLGYAIKMLSENPHVQEKLFEEILAVIGKDATPEFEQLQGSAMPYLDKVIKEIQRLSLIIPGFKRHVIKDTILGGKHIPKGTGLWINMTLMHRDPKYWKDPLVFNPERWNEDGIVNGGPVNPLAFMPFGAGSRICFGQKLAVLEFKFIVVYLTRTFFFKRLPRHLADRIGEEKYIQNALVELENVVALPVLRE